MKIQELLPIGVPPELSGQVFDELVNFLCDLVGAPWLDTKIAPASVRIIVAFAALEREGTVEAFRDALRARDFLRPKKD